MTEALYARVSTEEQKNRESIQTQLEYAERFAAMRGLRFAERFLDDGVRGAIPLAERPGGARLLEAARAGQVRTAYVYRIDRIGRDTRQILNAVYTLDELGCAVVSMTESFETATPAGKAMLGMLAVFAGFERDSIVQRTREGYDRAARMPGRWLGGPRAPYGYRVEGEDQAAVIVPDPEEESVVALIFSLAGQSWSSVRIAEYLTAMQIPSPAASLPESYWETRARPSGKWNRQTVRRLLRSTTYKGSRLHGKRRNRNLQEQECPALVDVATWDAAQRTLDTLRNPRTRPDERIYLLRGLIHCAFCGRVYHGWPQSERYYYYMCNGWHQKPKCEGRLLPAPKYEGMMWAEVEARLNQSGAADSALDEVDAVNANAIAARERERSLLETRISGKTEERARVLGLYRRGAITDAELDAQLAAVKAEQEHLTDRWQQLAGEESPEVSADRERLLVQIRVLLAQDLVPERKQKILALAVERIDLVPGEGKALPELHITWRV